MAKKKRPASEKPAPTVGQSIGKAIEDFFSEQQTGRHSPLIGSSDPRVDPAEVEPEFTGSWEDDTPILKQGPTPGNPERIWLSPDLMKDPEAAAERERLGLSPDGHQGELGDLSTELAQFSPEQIQQLLDDLYGKKGGIRNYTAPRKKGRVIYSTPIPKSLGGLKINNPPDLFDKTGPKITVPPDLFSGPLPPKINNPPDLFGGPLPMRAIPRTPLITVPPPIDRKTLLAALARLQAQAHGRNRLR